MVADANRQGDKTDNLCNNFMGGQVTSNTAKHEFGGCTVHKTGCRPTRATWTGNGCFARAGEAGKAAALSRGSVGIVLVK